jgi:hypothetical protein
MDEVNGSGSLELGLAVIQPSPTVGRSERDLERPLKIDDLLV